LGFWIVFTWRAIVKTGINPPKKWDNRNESYPLRGLMV
jgi:hypothetical protein